MAHARFLSILLAVLLLTLTVQVGGVEGEVDISHPGNIPKFSNFTTPQIIPGESGYLTFDLTNRYPNEMTNVEVLVEIYLYANIHESKELKDVKKVPIFASNSTSSTLYSFGTLQPDVPIAIQGNGFLLKSRESTEQGTYFVRFMLTFTYTDENVTKDYVMKSRGHFTDEEWDAATTDTTNDDPGNINITKLGVHGIIPDTTFGVKKPWPIWPLYVLGALSVMFAALAILTYMYEENTNPKFTRWVHKYQRKLGEYRALAIHEFRKFKRKDT